MPDIQTSSLIITYRYVINKVPCSDICTVQWSVLFFSLSTIHWAKCATIWWDWCCFANQFPRCPWLLHTPLLGGQWFALLRPCIAGFRCFLDSLRGCKQDCRYLNSHSEHLFRGGFVHSWCVLGRAKGLLQSKKSTKGIRCCLRYRCSLRYKMVSIAQGSIWARKGHGPREFYGFPQIFSASTSHIQCLRPLQVHQLPGDSSRQRPWVYFCRIGGSEACRDGHQELWLFNMCRTGPSAIFPRLHWLHVLKTHTDCHSDGLSCVTGWWFGTFEWMIFPIILGMSSSQLTFTPSFFRGVGWSHQPDNYGKSPFFKGKSPFLMVETTIFHGWNHQPGNNLVSHCQLRSSLGGPAWAAGNWLHCRGWVANRLAMWRDHLTWPSWPCRFHRKDHNLMKVEVISIIF